MELTGAEEPSVSRTRLWCGCSRAGEAPKNPLLNPSLLRLSPGCASLRALRSKVWSAYSRMWSLSIVQSSLCQDLVEVCIIFQKFKSLTKLELCLIVHCSSYTIKTTGMVGSIPSRTFLLAARDPGIIGRWHKGQYSLYLVNHSSRQCEWKA